MSIKFWAPRLLLECRRFWGTARDISALRSLFHAQSVAVVGNSRALSGSSHGPQIDSGSIVVRFNHAQMHSPISHGSKTDVLVTSVAIDHQRLRTINPKYLLAMSPRRKFNFAVSSHKELYLNSISEYNKILSETNIKRPTTGLMMLHFLKHSEASSVDIFGFDFYRSRSSSGCQTIDTTPHDYALEEAYVRTILMADERFRLWQ